MQKGMKTIASVLEREFLKSDFGEFLSFFAKLIKHFGVFIFNCRQRKETQSTNEKPEKVSFSKNSKFKTKIKYQNIFFSSHNGAISPT